MGYDIKRFKSPPAPEFVCSICIQVLEDPMQINCCQHIYCKQCISFWLLREKSCPQDRQPLTESDLRPVQRVFLSLLSSLELRCDFAPIGCWKFLTMDNLAAHRKDCPSNPELVMRCPFKCGALIRRKCTDSEFPSHSCLSYMVSKAKDSKDCFELLTGMVSVVERQGQDIAHLKAAKESMRVEREEDRAKTEKLMREMRRDIKGMQMVIESLQKEIERVNEQYQAKTETKRSMRRSLKALGRLFGDSKPTASGSDAASTSIQTGPFLVHEIQDKADLIRKLHEAGDRLVIINFFATWCAPCKAMTPKFEALGQEFGGSVVFLRADCDKNEEMANHYGVEVMPTFVFIRNRAKVGESLGANECKLKQTLHTFIHT